MFVLFFTIKNAEEKTFKESKFSFLRSMPWNHLRHCLSFETKCSDSTLNVIILQGYEDQDITAVSYVYVIILVNDVNDNKPLFHKSHYTFTVDENAPIGHVLTDQFSASDADIDVILIAFYLKYIRMIFMIHAHMWSFFKLSKQGISFNPKSMLFREHYIYILLLVPNAVLADVILRSVRKG